MDEWNLDVVVGGSQKAFMLPWDYPSHLFFAKIQKVYKNFEIYQNITGTFAKEIKSNEKLQTYTAQRHIVRALKVTIEIILKWNG